MFIRSWEKDDATSGLWDAWSRRTLSFCGLRGTGRPLYSDLGYLCLLHNATHRAWQLPPMLLHTVVSVSTHDPSLAFLSEKGKEHKKKTLYLSLAFEVSYWSQSVCPKHTLSQSLSLSSLAQCLCSYLCTGNTSTIVGLWNAAGRTAWGDLWDILIQITSQGGQWCETVVTLEFLSMRSSEGSGRENEAPVLHQFLPQDLPSE